MTDQDEITVIDISTNDVVYNQDKAAIDSMVATAKAYPRNVKRSIENAIAIVTMDDEVAASCTFSLPRAGKAITGPSIHLAKVLAQCWGNMRIEAKTLSVDERTLSSQGIAFDLESNLAFKVEIKRSIMTKSGRMNDDMIVVTGNAGNSIAMRNAIFATIPRAIVDKVHSEAKSKVIGDVSDKTKLIARRKQIFDALKDTYSLNETEILSALGKAAIDHVTKDDLVTLIGIGQAIKDGDTTVDFAFKGGEKQKRNNYKAVPTGEEQADKNIDKASTIKGIKSKADLVKAYGTGLLSAAKYNELLGGFSNPIQMP